MSDWNRASASQIKTFRACNRKWYYESVKRMRPPSRNEASLNRGTAIHAIIEHYLVYGELVGDADLIDLMRGSIWWLDALRACGTLLVEHSFESTADWVVKTSGFIDVVHRTDDLLHVIDHKTTSNFRWMSNEEQLRQDPQAIIYCTEAMRLFPDYDEVSFTHHYILTARPTEPRFVTVTFTREELDRAIGEINLTERAMEQASTSEDATQVLQTLSSCGMYGGCPFAGICHDPFEMLAAPTQKENSMLDNLFNKNTTGTAATEVPPVIPTVYINCAPALMEYTTAEEWLKEEQTEWQNLNKIDYMASEFNKGPREIIGVAMVRFGKGTKKLPVHLVINTLTPLGALLAARQSEFGCPVVTALRG